ncbi:MAG: SDR family oxidoreductase, partial [Micromonospora sp.]
MAERSVLVTGGTGGLGGAVTAAFLKAGWRVVVPEREGAPTQPAGSGPVRLTADLLEPAGAAGAVELATADPAAPLRAVVNLVGGYASGGLVHETPVEEFERMLRINLRPTYLVTQAALPHLVAAGGGA